MAFIQGSENLRMASCQGNYGVHSKLLVFHMYLSIPNREDRGVSHYIKPVCADTSVHVFKVAMK